MYILDTDHASLYQSGNPIIGQRLTNLPPNQVMTTIITYSEQVAGRLAMVRRTRSASDRIQAYHWLQRTQYFFCHIPVLPFDEAADGHFQRLMASQLRVGTQDLLIAAIALAIEMTLLSRNLRDFRRVPDLRVEDWSIGPDG